MQEIIVCGGKRLFGSLVPAGSKNAVLPMLFSTLALYGVSEISNVADIGDVRIAIDILEKFGATVKRCGSTLTVDTTSLEYTEVPRSLTSKLRASSYLIGASLSRFGRFHMTEFGGCNFCDRPIDMHIAAAKALGCKVDSECIFTSGLSGSKIVFSKKSVGATINALLMAASATGVTVILGAAKEPHVCSFVDFLISAGAKIESVGDSFYIEGKRLHGASAEVIPDMIEAGTYMLAAPLTEGEITVKNAASLGLDSFFEVLTSSGIKVLSNGADVTVSGVPEKPIFISTAPYPAFPTDLQPQTAPLMAKYFGGRIKENVWQNRFSYLKALDSFGVRSISFGAEAEIYPSKLLSATVAASDLRGGAAALLAALSVDGESKIKNAEFIYRGYDDLISKLSSLGAKVASN